jgi:p-aminobenzoyl-glutamate transporter AbgT
VVRRKRRNDEVVKMCDKDIYQLGGFLILLQAADGILTLMGVTEYGVMMEGNAIMRGLMLEIGVAETLFITKLICIAVIIHLMLVAKTIPWIKRAMAGISYFYLFAAIFPWTYIISATIAERMLI